MERILFVLELLPNETIHNLSFPADCVALAVAGYRPGTFWTILAIIYNPQTPPSYLEDPFLTIFDDDRSVFLSENTLVTGKNH